jgi:precorrin-6B methylase 2
MANYVLKLSEGEVGRYRFMGEAAASSEGDRWAAAGIREGATVADVGCGPGAVSAVIGRIVGPTGVVHAVDRDPEALELARRLAREAGLSNVTTSEGTAARTGLSPKSVDVVMMRHVLAHNGGQEQAIVDHLATLVRPGGSVYLVDVDATAMRVHPSHRVPALTELSQQYVRFHSGRGNDLTVGLRLGELLRGAGLEDVDHQGRYQIFRPPPGMRPPAWAARDQMLAERVLTEEHLSACETEFAQLDRGELDLTMFVPSFTAWGRKPT